MKTNRFLIVLAFAIATFATLRLTMRPRWHGRNHCGHHAACWSDTQGSQEQQ